MKHSATGPEQFKMFDLIILLLSIYVLAALIVDTFVPISPQISHVLNIIDNMICFVFLYDFIKDFYRAPDKLKFMKWGWIDLLSSIPYLDYFRAGRVLRILRLLRLLRAFRSIKILVDYMFRKRAKGAFTTAAIFAILMLLFASIAILLVETAPDSNIKTAEDAIWWCFATITTTGYGDRYPVTTEGRIIAVFLMIAGAGLFGTFTGYIASWFAQDREEHKEEQESQAD